MNNQDIIYAGYFWMFFFMFFLVVGDYTRPLVAFCISSVFEGLTIFETNPDV
jgi:hypothetical protein